MKRSNFHCADNFASSLSLYGLLHIQKKEALKPISPTFAQRQFACCKLLLQSPPFTHSFAMNFSWVPLFATCTYFINFLLPLFPPRSPLPHHQYILSLLLCERPHLSYTIASPLHIFRICALN